MRDEKWQDTVSKVKEKFKVLGEGKQEIEDIPRAFFEFIVFETPQGRFRLERQTQPVVLDKRATYSKTSGRASKVDYIYSETETFSKLRVYSYDEATGSWQEMKTKEMFSA